MESLRIIESVLGYSGDFFSALALEGGACEAGGPGPRGGFLLPHVLSPQRLPCPPAPARHLMMPCQSFRLCFFACPVLKKFTDVEWCAQRVINYVSEF